MARMMKVQLNIFKTIQNIVKHKLVNQVAMKVYLKKPTGQHEFIFFLRAFIGTLLPCIDKSNLINIVEELPFQKIRSTGQTEQKQNVKTRNYYGLLWLVQQQDRHQESTQCFRNFIPQLSTSERCWDTDYDTILRIIDQWGDTVTWRVLGHYEGSSNIFM